MFNKIILPSPLRKRLTFCAVIIAIICCAVLLADITVYKGMKTSLNGESSCVQGVITDIGYEGSNINTVILQDGTQYNVVSLADYAERKLDYDNAQFKQVLQSLFYKTVNLYSPLQYSTTPQNKWLLGITEENGTTVFDFDDVVETMYADDHKTVVICTVIVCVLATATALLILWKINSPELVERELAHQYAKFFAERQPSNKERIQRKLFIPLIIWAIACVVLLAVVTSAELSQGWETALTIADLVLEFGSLFVGVWLMGGAIWKKDVELYSEKFPFDFCDISHLRINKQQMQEITEQLREHHEKYPHHHVDGGNGYDVEFTAEGCVLRIDPELLMHEQPDISDVELDSLTSTEIHIPYDQLNFEAVPVFGKKDHPLMIVIKSRLDADKYSTDEMRNDLHFLYDVNLQSTLQTFSVPVEGLQEILDNKRELMINFKKSKTK